MWEWASAHPVAFTILALPIVLTLCTVVGAVLGIEVIKHGDRRF